MHARAARCAHSATIVDAACARLHNIIIIHFMLLRFSMLHDAIFAMLSLRFRACRSYAAALIALRCRFFATLLAATERRRL